VPSGQVVAVEGDRRGFGPNLAGLNRIGISIDSPAPTINGNVVLKQKVADTGDSRASRCWNRS
jgi:hypothetical protein